MPKCKHGHNHGHHHEENEEKADLLTNLGTIGESVSSFISDSYWLGTLFDLASGFEAEALGLSYYAIAVGATLAILSAGGAAYAHRNLNQHHQKQKKIDEEAPAETSGLIDHSHEHHHEHTGEHADSHAGHLTTIQKLALVGDFVSHVGDYAGPIVFVTQLATGQKLPRWGKAIAQCGATLFGAVTSLADVRTCKNAMIDANRNNAPRPG